MVHSKEVIEKLKKYSTPTISNAIEVFDVRPRNVGFMNHEIRCIFPEMGVMVGYAATAKIRANVPPPPNKLDILMGYWKHILEVPEPRVVVIEDLDEPKAIGSWWGEVNATIHKRLGCVGTVTDGGVRDLDEVKEIGFHFFAKSAIVSHAYVHVVEFGTPVKVGGIEVKPGDLIHGDKHGVLIVPHEVALRIEEGVEAVAEREKIIMDYCKSKEFTLEGLKDRIGRSVKKIQL
jgi:regulator of RNase E activity RraA